MRCPLQIRKLILRGFISACFSLDFPELPSPPIPSSPGCLEGICFLLCFYSGFVPFGSLLYPQGLEQGLAQSRSQELFVEWMDKSSLRFWIQLASPWVVVELLLRPQRQLLMVINIHPGNDFLSLSSFSPNSLFSLPWPPGKWCLQEKEETTNWSPPAASSLTSPMVMCVKDFNCISFSRAKEKTAVRNLMPVCWLTTQHEHMLRDFRHSERKRAKQSPTP